MVTRVERIALGALIAFTALAVLGYATIGRHPSLIAGNPSAQLAYGTAFVFFARGQVLVAGAALFVVLVQRAKLAWLPAFVAIYCTSLASELAGTSLGLPFGPYSYTEALGIKWFAHVPLLIPLSWFLMAVPSFAIAGLLSRSAIGRIAVGSVVLLSWDLALDPAMSFATRYWVWGEKGPYYGMPWLNLFGWYVTGVALMSILGALKSERWIAQLPMPWLTAFYIVNVGLALGICAAAGLYWAVVASAIPMLFCIGALRRHRTVVASLAEASAA
ncbi:MAG TPA: carotenoid biosynthesis protein [Gemmatimonadaceae bacterium]|jgi:putative membrane protein